MTKASEYTRRWQFKHPEYKTLWRKDHREHYLTQHRLDEKRRRERNPLRVKELKRVVTLRLRHGLTREAFEAAWTKQLGLCLICLKTLNRGRKTHIDHDHATGKFRGLLCNACNMGLGQFRDSIDSLNRAIEYLARSRE